MTAPRLRPRGQQCPVMEQQLQRNWIPEQLRAAELLLLLDLCTLGTSGPLHETEK